MKKFIILFVLALIGSSLFLSQSSATESRTISHKFLTVTTSTAYTAGKTIYRITGVTTAANGVFGIYNTGTLAGADTTNCAIEGGEATAGYSLPHYDFGVDGLFLDAGSTVVVSNCYVTIEYL